MGGVIRGDWFGTLGYEPNARRRRKTLSRLFEAIRATGQLFTARGLQEALRARGDGPVPPVEEIARYVRVLARGGALVAEPGQEEVPLGERSVSLEAGQWSVSSLILAYESKVVARLIECAGDLEVGAADVAVVLGLDAGNLVHLAWSLALLDRVGGIAEIDPPTDADVAAGRISENARDGLDRA